MRRKVILTFPSLKIGKKAVGLKNREVAYLPSSWDSNNTETGVIDSHTPGSPGNGSYTRWGYRLLSLTLSKSYSQDLGGGGGRESMTVKLVQK